MLSLFPAPGELTGVVLPTFFAPTKCELDGTSDTFLEAEFVGERIKG